jgi:hypothetical protein
VEIEWLTSLVLWLAGDRLAFWWWKYVQMPWWQYVEMSWWSARSWWFIKGQWWWHSTGLWWVMFMTGMTAPFVWFGLLCRALHHDMAFPEETAAGVAVIAVAIGAALFGLWIWLPSETFIKILQTHGALVGLCLGCILCRRMLPRTAYEFVRLAAGWSPVLAVAMALSWYGYAWLGQWWPFGFLVLAVFAFTSHVCSKINQRNTAIRQQLAAELAAYHARRKTLMEEFNPSVIDYTPEETDAYQKNLAWFENKTPEPSWFTHLSRQELREAIDYARESFPTPQAYLDDREQKYRQWRDEARALAPEYASFLNGYPYNDI